MNWRCQDHSLVGVDGRRVRVTALRCRRWSCPFCAKRLHARMVRRAMAGFISGQRVRMMTLTAPASDTVERSYDQQSVRWKRFRERLRRAFPGIRLEYFKVIERQRRGHAHLHVLFRGGFIPQRWLSAAAAKAGFGPIADVREVGKQAARYVSKYLAKEMGDTPELLGLPPLPSWHRRASWSRAWAPAFQHSWQSWLVQQAMATFRWYIASSNPVRTAQQLAQLDYELVALDVGEAAAGDSSPWLAGAGVRWRAAGANHRPCWLCETDHPARHRRHAPDWEAIPPAPPLVLELWPAL
jgi:hypothetical protein